MPRARRRRSAGRRRVRGSPGARRARRGLRPERIVFCGSNADASSWLRAARRRDDVILLKGSRKYKLEESSRECVREHGREAWRSRARKSRPGLSRYRSERRSCAAATISSGVVRDAVRGIARGGDVIADLGNAQWRSRKASSSPPSTCVRRRWLTPFAARRPAGDRQPARVDATRHRSRRAGGKSSTRPLLHAVGRLSGNRGAFYEVLGEAMAAIDGYTGTMPPYERAIVFAPREPERFRAGGCGAAGIACAVVDANDLGKAKVLGASRGVDAANVRGRAARQSARKQRRADAAGGAQVAWRRTESADEREAR